MPSETQPIANLVVLTGDYSPQRNGICDYILTLIEASAAHLNQITLITLADSAQASATQALTPQLELLRLTQAMPFLAKVRALRRALKAVERPVLSIQFNVFSFHSIGLCLGWAAVFAVLTVCYPTQFMVHELWVGSSVREPLKKTLLGWVQSLLVRALFACARPRLVHTSNADYAARLRRLTAAPVRILPLFSAIPPQPANPQLLLQQCPEVSALAEAWVIGHFGTFTPYGPGDWLQSFLEALFSQCRELPPLALLSFGLNHRTDLIERYRSRFPWQRFLVLGPQPPELISQMLLCCQVGLCSTPLAMAGKSSAAAAYLEHGLPVLCCPVGAAAPQRSDPASNPFLHPAVPEIIPALPQLPCPPIGSRVQQISRQFLADLQEFCTPGPA